MLGRVCVMALVAYGMAVGQAAPGAATGAAAVRAQAVALRQFDAVSMKPSGPKQPTGLMFGLTPSGFVTNHQPLITVVMMAYFPMTRMFGYSASPVTGAPEWVTKDLYDIDAKYDEETAEALKNATATQRQETVRPMLQAVLAERCKLAAHMTMVDGPVYELVVSKRGAKLKETAPDEAPPEHALPIEGDAMMVPIYPKPAKEQLTFFRTSMAALATHLSTMMDRQVVDRTGLTRKYDFAVPRVRRELPDGTNNGTASDPNPDPFIWDVSELGLELRPAKAPQPVLVIDHIEKPSEN
jgi:uncharacterized protein (TIGR03435 family)